MKTSIYRIVEIDNDYNYNVTRMECEFYANADMAIAAIEKELKNGFYNHYKIEDWKEDMNRFPWKDVRTEGEGWRVARIVKKLTWEVDCLTHVETRSKLIGILGYYFYN